MLNFPVCYKELYLCTYMYNIIGKCGHCHQQSTGQLDMQTHNPIMYEVPFTDELGSGLAFVFGGIEVHGIPDIKKNLLRLPGLLRRVCPWSLFLPLRTLLCSLRASLWDLLLGNQQCFKRRQDKTTFFIYPIFDTSTIAITLRSPMCWACKVLVHKAYSKNTPNNWTVRVFSHWMHTKLG